MHVTVPSDWKKASDELGFLTVDQMDNQTQTDMQSLQPEAASVPCASVEEDGVVKCEACTGGCQIWDDIPKDTQPVISNERTHYVTPQMSPLDSADDNPDDVILYRTGEPFLYASIRPGSEATNQSAWGAPVATNIPNDETNINTGTLPNKMGIYLVSNPVYIPKVGGDYETVNTTLRFRDPVTVAVSVDGWNFSHVQVVMTCTNLSAESTCAPRVEGGGKNPGPSYPQAISIVNPSDDTHDPNAGYFYVVATNNKEDVWMTRLPLSALSVGPDACATSPAPSSFDSVLRPCSDDQRRVDAYLVPPPCPSSVSQCVNSSNHCASLQVIPHPNGTDSSEVCFCFVLFLLLVMYCHCNVNYDCW